MSTLKIDENPIDFEQFVREALECPVCIDKIKSGPIYQCTNGHMTCKNCIPKLDRCPICRSHEIPVRCLKLEQIVQKLNGTQPDDTSNEMSENLNWNTDPITQEFNVQVNLRPSSNTNFSNIYFPGFRKF